MPNPPRPESALHLHLDVSSGARAESVVGALMAAARLNGARDSDANADVKRALTAVGIVDAAVHVDVVRVHGVRAHAPRIEIAGAPLSTPEAFAVAPPRRRRERPFAFVREAREARALTPVSTAVHPHPDAAPPEGGRRRARKGSGPVDPRGRRSASRGAHGALVTSWTGGALARPKDLVVAVRASALGPVAKALALRAATRMVEALGAVRDDVDAPIWSGAHAVRALAHIAAASALVDAIDASVITASPVSVSSLSALDDGVALPALAPSPWVTAVLEGAPCLDDDGHRACPVDVVGAALVRTLASRFGARGWFRTSRQVFGACFAPALGARDPSALAVVTRALLGPAAPLATRAGDTRLGTDVVVTARLALGYDADALGRALFAAGAQEPVSWPVDDGAGRAVLATALVPHRTLDAAVGALWRAGALAVSAVASETRRPGVEEVTVPVGRGRNRQAVRVRVILDDNGSVLSAQAVLDDVRAAARAQRRPEELVRSDAIAAWSLLASESGRDDDEGGA